MTANVESFSPKSCSIPTAIRLWCLGSRPHVIQVIRLRDSSSYPCATLVAKEWVMALYYSPLTLQNTLEQNGKRLFKPRGEVLFRRGEEALMMFVLLSGNVRLDFGVDSPLARCYGPGALVGLPATLTGRAYRMTATVTQDAELSAWSRSALDILLRKRRDFCQQLLVILGEKMAESQALAKSLAYRETPPTETSYVA